MAQEYQSAENFSGMATVFVSLVKQNSGGLVFSQDEYVVRLSENPQLGQFVVKVAVSVDLHSIHGYLVISTVIVK